MIRDSTCIFINNKMLFKLDFWEKMRNILNFKSITPIILLFLLIINSSQVKADVNHVEVDFESGTYVSVPFALDFGEIRFPNIEMGLSDINKIGVPTEENMVFEYYNETIKINRNGKVNVDISAKMIFQTFYETEIFNISKLEERSHIEIGGLGASPITIGSLILQQGDIMVRPSIPGIIKEVREFTVQYENESRGYIQSIMKWEAGPRRMFHILLTENLTNFQINDTSIILNVSFVMENSMIESFYSKDQKKQEIQIRYVPQCYIFDMTYNVILPEEIRLIKADNLQGFESDLYFNQKIVTPNEVKTFNIEYLEYLGFWERILNDPLFNLFWAGLGGFFGALFGILLGLKWKNRLSNRLSYKNKWWLRILCIFKTNKKIAEKYDVSRSTIYYWKKKFKI